MPAASWIDRGIFNRGAGCLGIFTPDECILPITEGSTGRGRFCTALPKGPAVADTVEGGWINAWVFAGGGCIWFAHRPEFADAVKGACLGPWGLGGDPGFGLQHQLSEEACLVVCYSPQPEDPFVVGYSPEQHLIF